MTSTQDEHAALEDLPNGPLLIGLGESLFDCLPDSMKLGGAPVNLAVHADALLKAQGGGALPATRVGADDLGERYVGELRDRGLSTTGVQTDDAHPTGRVLVELDASGHATYDFEANVAWDYLEMTPHWSRLAQRASAVAFGTLAQRSPQSRETIMGFLAEAQNAIKLFDVNLRGDFYSADVLRDSLEVADAVKLNEEELDKVHDLLGLPSPSGQDVESRIRALSSTFSLDWLALTRGAEGTLLFFRDQTWETEPARFDAGAHPNADTVGAGDACCASLITGMLLGWPPERTLTLANRVGAFVASQPGATPRLPDELLALTRTGE